MNRTTGLSCELLVDQVYKDLKRRIINGELAPSDHLGTRVLCEYYNISDTPLKQALNRLLTEGLVESLPRRGMRVRSLDEDDIHEAIEARIMIETYAIPFIMRSLKKSDGILKRLEENLQEDKNLIMQVDDFSVYSEIVEREQIVSRAFHEILVEEIGNRVIIKAYKSIFNHRYIYYQFNKNKRQQVLASLEEHKYIVDCLRSQDEKKTREAIHNHLKTREYAVSSLYQA